MEFNKVPIEEQGIQIGQADFVVTGVSLKER